MKGQKWLCLFSFLIWPRRNLFFLTLLESPKMLQYYYYIADRERSIEGYHPLLPR